MKISSKLFVLCFCVSLMACKDGKQTNQSTILSDNTTINWLTLEEAIKKNEGAPRYFYVMVHANWCPKCERFEQETYTNAKVINQINKEFYPVKINAHEPADIAFKGKTFGNPNYDQAKGLEQMNSYHEILFELEAKAVPSLVFLDSDLEIVGTEMGFKEADELRSLMNLYLP